VTVTAVNDAPTIVAGTISRQQGAGTANALIAAVGDVDDAKGALVLTVNNATSATTNGVTMSNIAVNALGNVTADVAAGCGATAVSLPGQQPRLRGAAAALIHQPRATRLSIHSRISFMTCSFPMSLRRS
jgi:hypothetical protein